MLVGEAINNLLNPLVIHSLNRAQKKIYFYKRMSRLNLIYLSVVCALFAWEISFCRLFSILMNINACVFMNSIRVASIKKKKTGELIPNGRMGTAQKCLTIWLDWAFLFVAFYLSHPSWKCSLIGCALLNWSRKNKMADSFT